MIKSKRGAIRRANAILSKVYRELRKGTRGDPGYMFSTALDWPTLRISWPKEYAELMELKQLYPSLPE